MQKLWKWVKIKVFLGFFLLIVISVFTVWVIYSEMSQLTLNKARQSPKNDNAIYITTILNNLYETEALERTYSQLGDNHYYSDYKELMDTIYMQIDTLSYLLNSKVQRSHLDSIRALLDKKRKNIQDLVRIKANGTSEDLYNRALSRLTYNHDSIDYFLKVYKTEIENRDSIYIKQEKANFLVRLINAFSPQENQDSALQVIVSHSISIDSILNTYNKTDSIEQFLTAMMNDIRVESINIEKQLVHKEQEILTNNQTITFQVRQMLLVFENDEFLHSYNELKMLRDRVGQTTKIMIALGLTAFIIIVFFLVSILKDISRSQRYRKELVQAKLYSDSLLKSKEQFMLSITHDLKSPLGSIVGYARLLSKAGKEKQKDYYLSNINKSSEHILRLINDLVDFTQLEIKKLKIEHVRFNLKTLVDEIFSAFYPIALSKNLKLNLHFGIPNENDYRGDPVRLKQVLGNLISNALKFTDNGKVELQVSVFESFKNTDCIRLDVSDTGIGISNEDQKTIFDEFSRGDHKNQTHYEGAGLGLTISQRITALLKGSITLKSTPGRGSVFTVKLPLEKCVVAKEQIPLVPSQLKNRHVLLIDDDEVILNMTTDTLKSVGMIVSKCSLPSQALQLLETTSFDLIMTDICMSTMNGFCFLKLIRKKFDINIPVIAMTGRGELLTGDCSKAGFAACLYKPFFLDQLLKQISQVLVGVEKKSLNDNVHLEIGNIPKKKRNYNLKRVKQFVLNDSGSLRKVLISFIQTNKENMVLFRQYLDKQDYDSLSGLAHKMLPMFRQLEVSCVIEPLSKIERREKEQLNHEQLNRLGNSTLRKIEQTIIEICEEQNVENS